MAPSPGSRRRSHRSRRSRRSKRASRRVLRFGGALLLFAMALVAAAFTLNRIREQRQNETVATLPDSADASTDSVEPVAATVKADPPVYPYSVIPGGVDSVEALKAAIHRDPVVAEHYREFDLSKARVERLETPQLAHVSYRIGNSVFWTRKQLVLPAGERVISDGTHIARTRCGNQLAATPATTSAAEPSARELDTPVVQKPGGLASLHPAMVPGGTPAPVSPGTAPGLTAGPSSRPAGAGGIVPGLGGGAVGSSGIVPNSPWKPAGTPDGPTEPPTQNTPPTNSFNPPSGPPGLPPGFVPPGLPGPPSFTPPGNPFLPPGTPGNPNIPTDFTPPGTPGDPNTPTDFTPPGTPGNPGNPDNPGTPTDPNDPHQPDVPTPVPEPSSVMLMLMGLGGIATRLRRRTRNW
jgi:hypothetical protein